MRWTTFGDCVQAHAGATRAISAASSSSSTCRADRVPLQRRVERFPYVPADPARRDERCAEVYDIQVEALRKRLVATGLQRVVIGISGGLDSTQAALVAVRAFDRLGWPRSEHPRLHDAGLRHEPADLRQCACLMQALGIGAAEIDIRPSAELMLRAHRPSVRGRQGGARHHVRKRAGGRAHVAPVPARESARRARARHRRPVRAGARLHDVRRRRSHVALQRERVGAEDADPAPDPLADRARASSMRDTLAVLGRIVDTPISPELVPGNGDRPDAIVRGRRRSVRAAGLPPVLREPLRLSAEQGRISRAVAPGVMLARGAWPDTVPLDERRSYDLDDDPPLARSVPEAVFPDEPVQALGDAERPEGRLGRFAVAAQRLACAERFAGDGVARRIARQRAGRAAAARHQHDHGGRR